LAAGEEPTLGRVWAHVIPAVKSPKFLFCTYYLTKLLKSVQDLEPGRPVEIIEIGSGYGSCPRLVSLARARLLSLPKPIDVQSYSVLDLSFVIDLQRWYLKKTTPAGTAKVLIWPAGCAFGEANQTERNSKCWSMLGPSEPLRLHLVSREQRDAFAHAFSEAHGGMGNRSKEETQRPLRLLLAMNSWHEFAHPEYLWFYNTFVAGPSWRAGVDYVSYVSNREWSGNTEKEQLLMSSGAAHKIDVLSETCTDRTCYRVLRRTDV